VELNKKSIGAVLATGLVLGGCETTNPKENIDVNLPMASLNAKREVSPAITQTFQLLKEKKYREASQFINQVLQAQPKSVIFHVLNGVTYEKLAETGDASGTELASIGYQNAINLDPSNSFALIQLGKLKYREQIYDQAQQHFANALLLKPNDADLWHELAAASYYAYDAKTAISAIDKAVKLKPDDPRVHRSATMIYASLGDFKTAKKHLDLFQAKAGKDPAVEYVLARYNDWESLYFIIVGELHLPLQLVRHQLAHHQVPHHQVPHHQVVLHQLVLHQLVLHQVVAHQEIKVAMEGGLLAQGTQVKHKTF